MFHCILPGTCTFLYLSLYCIYIKLSESIFRYFFVISCLLAYILTQNNRNSIGGVIVSVLASSVVGRGFEPGSGKTRDYQICICCFSDKHAALRRESKDWLAQNQSICWLLFQWDSTIKIQLRVCWSSTKWTSSSHWKLTCSGHDIAEKLLRWHSTTIIHSI